MRSDEGHTVPELECLYVVEKDANDVDRPRVETDDCSNVVRSWTEKNDFAGGNTASL